jgi:CRP/FNR family cyclic AMP-dependent transcriptional regulator
MGEGHKFMTQPDKQGRREDGLPGLSKTAHSLSEKIEMIDRTKWAEEFSWERVKTLAGYMDCYTVEKDRLLLREGGHDAHMVLIVQGEVNIVKEDTAQVRKVIATLGPGRTFGEMSLIDGEPRSASAVAASDVTLLVLPRDNFARLTKESPQLGLSLVLKIAKLMSQRLRQTSGKLIDYL